MITSIPAVVSTSPDKEHSAATMVPLSSWYSGLSYFAAGTVEFFPSVAAYVSCAIRTFWRKNFFDSAGWVVLTPTPDSGRPVVWMRTR